MKNNNYLKDFIDSYISDNKKNNIDIDKDECFSNVAKLLDIPHSKIFIEQQTIILDKKKQKKLTNNLNKIYVKKIPIQYILGYTYFYNEKYIVNKNVLIPRNDTEILVETACRYIKTENLKNLLDMCCGSGAVGISIAKNSNIEKIDFVDISKRALKVTKKNLLLNDVIQNNTVICSDLFKKFEKGFLKNVKYDIIVSNPPYISTSVIDTLSEYVKKEPVIALDGGKNGLDIYIKIIKDSIKYLNDNGLLIFEIGYDEKEVLTKYINSLGYFEVIEKIKDYGGNDRVIVCRFLRI